MFRERTAANFRGFNYCRAKLLRNLSGLGRADAARPKHSTHFGDAWQTSFCKSGSLLFSDMLSVPFKRLFRHYLSLEPLRWSAGPICQWSASRIVSTTFRAKLLDAGALGNFPEELEELLVPEVGLEPTCPCERQIL